MNKSDKCRQMFDPDVKLMIPGINLCQAFCFISFIEPLAFYLLEIQGLKFL